MTMKTCNYLTKLPQEATIKKVETFRYFDLITLDLPVPKQRLCPHCGWLFAFSWCFFSFHRCF